MIAIALRLLFMPIALHGDLLFINYFPHFFSYHGIWDIYGYFGDRFLKFYGISYYPPLTYYAIGISQFLLRPLNPDLSLWVNRVHDLMHSGAGRPIFDCLGDFSRAKTLWVLFWMKFPYLLIEAVSFTVALDLFKTSGEKRRAAIVWVSSPVILFSCYVFGQYRIFSVLTMLLAVWALQRGRQVLSGAMVGLTCLMENYAVLLLPFLFLAVPGNGRRKIRWLAAAIAVVSAVGIPLYFSSKGHVLDAYFSPRLMEAATTKSIFNHYSNILNPIAKGILLLSYSFVFFYLVKFVKRYKAPEAEAALFVSVPLMLLMILYATSITSIHYLMWSFPFLLVLQVRGEPWRPGLTWLMIGLVFFFNLDGRSMNLALFAPLDPAYFSSLPSFHERLDAILPWGKVVAGARFLFSVICLYFAWRIWSVKIRPALEA